MPRKGSVASSALPFKWENADKWLYYHHKDNVDGETANQNRSTSAKPTESSCTPTSSCKSVHYGLYSYSSPVSASADKGCKTTDEDREKRDDEHFEETPTHGRSSSMKDAYTEVSPSTSKRDMGTQMTPTSSSCSSPIGNSSPPRHNTPVKNRPKINNMRSTNPRISIADAGDHISPVEIESCHLAKLELSTLPCGSKIFHSFDDDTAVRSSNAAADVSVVDSRCMTEGKSFLGSFSLLETRTAAWEEAERAKFIAKYKREQARIEAWENLQRAKAEAELKRLEVKLEKLRSEAIEKVTKRVALVEKQADEMRAVVESKQMERMGKIRARTSESYRAAAGSTAGADRILFPCCCFGLCIPCKFLP